MTERNFNMESFTHAININAACDDVFKYIGTPSGISRWFIGNASYYYDNASIRLGDALVQKGDSYLWKWKNKDLELKGIVTESETNKIFQFTFSPLYIVTIRLSAESGKTRVTLNQKYQESAVRDDFNYINCCACWVFFLTNLKSVIEHDIDLRETNADDEMLVNI